MNIVFPCDLNIFYMLHRFFLSSISNQSFFTAMVHFVIILLSCLMESLCVIVFVWQEYFLLDMLSSSLFVSCMEIT